MNTTHNFKFHKYAAIFTNFGFQSTFCAHWIAKTYQHLWHHK